MHSPPKYSLKTQRHRFDWAGHKWLSTTFNKYYFVWCIRGSVKMSRWAAGFPPIPRDLLRVNIRTKHWTYPRPGGRSWRPWCRTAAGSGWCTGWRAADSLSPARTSWLSGGELQCGLPASLHHLIPPLPALCALIGQYFQASRLPIALSHSRPIAVEEGGAGLKTGGEQQSLRKRK